ncbi:MAG: M23 family metallopeptidase [Bacteroidota bacterium]
MPEKKKKSTKWYARMRDKYRLVILNNETYEERLSFRLSRLNVFLLTVSISILLITLTIFIIAFTPIREYIPGYLDVNIPGQLYRLEQRADSLEKALKAKDIYLMNIRNIIEGKEIVDSIPSDIQSDINYDSISIVSSPEDSLLRAQYDKQTQYNLFLYESEELYDGALKMSNILFFQPADGIIINKFNLAEKHYGIDIATSKESIVKSVLDGTVIFADWTTETGYTIAIQHSGNFVSVYKHNSTLLKGIGNFIKAGESVAISGDSGELSSGPHLHFELWHNGTPVDPEEYITF